MMCMKEIHNLDIDNRVGKIPKQIKSNNKNILAENVTPKVDILKIRLINKNTSEGNIAVLDAEKFYINIIKLLISAACDLIDPKKYHKGNYKEKVYEFIKSCYFGQTQKGSYIVQIQVPIKIDEEKNAPNNLFQDEEFSNSFGRKVITRIMNSANATKNCIDSEKTAELLDRSGEDVISANFLNALAGLNLDTTDTTVELSTELSEAVPIIDDSVCQNIGFTSEYYAPMISLSEVLKQDSEENKIDVTGYVQGVRSDASIIKRKNGKVSIAYKDGDNRNRTLKVILNLDNYNLALTAHTNGYRINFQGIRKEDNTVECIDFKIIDTRYFENDLFKKNK